MSSKIKIYQSPYSLNLHNNKILKGCLLCFEFDSNFRGYSDFLAWPDYDKKTLSQQLEEASKGHFSKRFLQAKRQAWIDANARQKKQNLFYGLKIPTSHFLIKDLLSFKDEKEILFWNYQAVKVKIQPTHIKEQLQKLKSLISACPKSIRWRLDFDTRSLKSSQTNLSEWDLQANTFLKEFYKLPLEAIDFIEDAPLALQKKLPPNIQASDWEISDYAKIKVAKPSRDSLPHIYSCLSRHPFKRVIFTHSFDHPLGQAIGAFWAAAFYKNYMHLFEISGLKCLDFKDNEFYFHQDEGPNFKSPSGFGFGFHELLNEQKWESIV